MKDPVIEKTEQVIDALSYAHEHNLDIHNRDDIKKILKGIGFKQVSDEEIEEFMRLLDAGNSLIERDVERRDKLN